MPNRILRDWTTSKRINSVSDNAEILFNRLIMKMDDAGNFYADAQLIKSLAFPLKNDIRITDIDRWLKQLKAADLIRYYPAKGDVFLHIVKHGQRKDRTHIIYPKEPEGFDERSDDEEIISPPLAASRREQQPETKRNETESETRLNPSARPFKPPDLLEVENYFLEKNFSIEIAGQAFSHYAESEPPWHDSRGHPVIDWKQKMRTVWMKKENLTKNKDGNKFNKAEQASSNNRDQLARVMDGTL